MTGHNQQNRDCSKSLNVETEMGADSPFDGPSFTFQFSHYDLPRPKTRTGPRSIIERRSSPLQIPEIK
jgi:hypothetical protein